MAKSGALDREQRKIIANKVLAVCLAPTTVVTTWALPLFDKAFDNETELRNKLFCLLICGILDASYEYRVRINGLKTESKKANIAAGAFYLDMFERYIALGVDMLERIHRDEFVFLKERRDQWLHGHWSEIHKENRVVMYAEKGRVTKEKISWNEFSDLERPLIHKGVDNTISEIRERVTNYKTFYWAVDRALSAPVLRDHIQRDLLLFENFVAPDVILEIPDPSFRPAGENDAFASLLEIGPRFATRDNRYRLSTRILSSLSRIWANIKAFTHFRKR